MSITIVKTMVGDYKTEGKFRITHQQAIMEYDIFQIWQENYSTPPCIHEKLILKGEGLT